MTPRKSSNPCLEHHWVITGTGFYGAERAQIKQEVLAVGAEYSGDLVLGRSTHLICRDSQASQASNKLLRAQQWGLVIRDYSWLQQRLEHGHKQAFETEQRCCCDDRAAESKCEGAGCLESGSCSSSSGRQPAEIRELSPASLSDAAGGTLRASRPAVEQVPKEGNVGGPHQAESACCSTEREVTAACSVPSNALEPASMPLGTAGPPGLHAAKLAQGTAGYPGLLDDELEANTAGLSKLEEQGLPADEVADLSKMASPAQLQGPDHHSDAGQVARSGAQQDTSPSSASTAGSAAEVADAGKASGRALADSSTWHHAMKRERQGCGALGASKTSAEPLTPLLSRHNLGSTGSGTLQGCTAWSQCSSSSCHGPNVAARYQLPAAEMLENLIIPDSAPLHSDDDFQLPWCQPCSAEPQHQSSGRADAAAGRSPKRSADGVGLKLMARQPRGTTARQWHGLPSWRGVLFAEEVQVPDGPKLVRDKKTCALLHLEPADDQEEGSQASQIIAEPQAFYKLPSGEWWLEYCRMWRATEVQEAMRQGHQGGGRWLPLGTDMAQELFQGVVREHCRLSCVAGNTTAKRSKQLGFISKGKLGAMYFWRTIFDCENLQLLTDAPASKFLQH